MRDDKTLIKFRANRKTVQNTKDLTRIFVILGAMFCLMALMQIAVCKIEKPGAPVVECFKPRSLINE